MKEWEKQEDHDPPKEWGDLLGQDTVGPSPPALGGETGAINQQDKATNYPGPGWMDSTTSEDLAKATQDLNRGTLHLAKRVRHDNAPPLVGEAYQKLLRDNDIK